METVQPSACGFDAARLDHFVACMQNDIEQEQYDGAVVIVAAWGTSRVAPDARFCRAGQPARHAR